MRGGSLSTGTRRAFRSAPSMPSAASIRASDIVAGAFETRFWMVRSIRRRLRGHRGEGGLGDGEVLEVNDLRGPIDDGDRRDLHDAEHRVLRAGGQDRDRGVRAVVVVVPGVELRLVEGVLRPLGVGRLRPGVGRHLRCRGLRIRCRCRGHRGGRRCRGGCRGYRRRAAAGRDGSWLSEVPDGGGGRRLLVLVGAGQQSQRCDERKGAPRKVESSHDTPLRCQSGCKSGGT